MPSRLTSSARKRSRMRALLRLSVASSCCGSLEVATPPRSSPTPSIAALHDGDYARQGSRQALQRAFHSLKKVAT
eukprot:2362871-Prymnesium_polylepis.1